MKRHVHALTLAFALVFVTYTTLKLAPATFAYPYLWLLPALGLYALNILCLYPHRAVRLLAANTAVLSLALFAVESICVCIEPLTLDQRRTITYANSPGVPAFSGAERTLGYRPWPNNAAQVTYTIDQTVLHLAYTIDAHGLRVTPASTGPNPDALLFFGGSFMFGEGVNDQDAMPYLIGAARRDRAQSYNFAFIGYGTHQMYAAIESGWVFRVVGDQPAALAVYQAIPEHIRRVLNQRPWTGHDPCYRLVPRLSPGGHGSTSCPLRPLAQLEGERLASRVRQATASAEPPVCPAPQAHRACLHKDLERLGNYDELPEGRGLLKRSLNQLAKSAVFRRLARARGEHSSDDELALFVALIEHSRRKLQGCWPELRFLVLYWDDPTTESERQIRALRSAGLEVQRVSEIVPDWFTGRARYLIHPSDQHPNAEAHRLVARYVLGLINEK